MTEIVKSGLTVQYHYVWRMVSVTMPVIAVRTRLATIVGRGVNPQALILKNNFHVVNLVAMLTLLPSVLNHTKYDLHINLTLYTTPAKLKFNNS